MGQQHIKLTFIFYTSLIILHWLVEIQSEDYSVKTSPKDSKTITNGNGTSTSPSYQTITPDGDIRPVSINPAYRNWAKAEADRHAKPKSRIVGGRKVNTNEVPYQFSIGVHGFGQWCGGTIYNKLWIITAAHCFFEGENLKNISDFYLAAGEFDLSRKDPTEQPRKMVEYIVHENYKPSIGLFDVALIKLDNPLEYTDSVQPLPLAPINESYPSGEAVISGWGYTEVRMPGVERDESTFDGILRSTTVQIYPREECQEAYGVEAEEEILKYVKDPNFLCAGELEGGKDACQGDSGGPLACTNNDKVRYLCGIISTGLGCGLPMHPGFFAITAKFVDWITKHAGSSDEPLKPYQILKPRYRQWRKKKWFNKNNYSQHVK